MDEKKGYYTVKQLFTGAGPKPKPSTKKRKKTSAQGIVAARQKRSRAAKGSANYGTAAALARAAMPGMSAVKGKRRSSKKPASSPSSTSMHAKAGYSHKSAKPQTGSSANTSGKAYAENKKIKGSAKKMGSPRSPSAGMARHWNKGRKKKGEFSFGKAIRRGFGQLG